MNIYSYVQRVKLMSLIWNVGGLHKWKASNNPDI